MAFQLFRVLLQGFGGITSGVIREAAQSAKRPALALNLALLAAVSFNVAERSADLCTFFWCSNSAVISHEVK